MNHTTGSISKTCKWCGGSLDDKNEINYHQRCWIQFQLEMAQREKEEKARAEK